jgi:hypothetical protein
MHNWILTRIYVLKILIPDILLKFWIYDKYWFIIFEYWSIYICNIYIYKYYSTPSCYIEQNSLLFSTRVSVLFSIFEVLGVVLTDTERGSVVLSIFSGQF